MFFGRVPVAMAESGVVAHRLSAGGQVFAKGHRLSAADCRALAAGGIAEVTIAREEPGDIGEDEAARRLAEAARGESLRAAEAFTGRVNLFSEADGVLRVDAAAIERFNALDEGMTIATLSPFRRVRAGEMVATVKIIPFALPGAVVARGLAAFSGEKPLTVAAFRPRRVGLILLALPETKTSILAKTAKVTAGRLAALGCTLAFERRLPHDEAALAGALAALDPESFEILLIFGAAAISDRRDVIPQAIVQQGGKLVHLGMPVDPGNLLLLAEFAGRPVIGAPGCARSPVENGFDWVLERLCAGLTVSAPEIRAMGVGGLLMEIGSRPQPRLGAFSEEVDAGSSKENAENAEVGAVSDRTPLRRNRSGFAALVLAAGASSRFVGGHKLLAELEGRPMVSHVFELVRRAPVDFRLVITGARAEEVGALAAKAGLNCRHNPDYAQGLSTSLRAGLAQLPADCEGALILLADMPFLRPETLVALLAAARAHPECAAIVPARQGEWGHPVLLRRAIFAEIAGLSGDTGARALLKSRADVLVLAVEDPGILVDIDTREALVRGLTAQ